MDDQASANSIGIGDDHEHFPDSDLYLAGSYHCAGKLEKHNFFWN